MYFASALPAPILKFKLRGIIRKALKFEVVKAENLIHCTIVNHEKTYLEDYIAKAFYINKNHGLSDLPFFVACVRTS